MLVIFSAWLCCVWMWSVFLTDPRRPWSRWVAQRASGLVWLGQELRPAYLPALMIWQAHDIAIEPQRWWDWLFRAVMVWIWFDQKSDGRWKRRRHKVVERVKVVAGRLVVVSAGT